MVVKGKCKHTVQLIQYKINYDKVDVKFLNKNTCKYKQLKTERNIENVLVI